MRELLSAEGRWGMLDTDDDQGACWRGVVRRMQQSQNLVERQADWHLNQVAWSWWWDSCCEKRWECGGRKKWKRRQKYISVVAEDATQWHWNSRDMSHRWCFVSLFHIITANLQLLQHEMSSRSQPGQEKTNLWVPIPHYIQDICYPPQNVVSLMNSDFGYLNSQVPDDVAIGEQPPMAAWLNGATWILKVCAK